jgi:hypothetical protein
MVSGQALVIVIVVAGGLWIGEQTVKQTDKHVIKPVYHHVIQPVGKLLHKLQKK